MYIGDPIGAGVECHMRYGAGGAPVRSTASGVSRRDVRCRCRCRISQSSCSALPAPLQSIRSTRRLKRRGKSCAPAARGRALARCSRSHMSHDREREAAAAARGPRSEVSSPANAEPGTKSGKFLGKPDHDDAMTHESLPHHANSPLDTVQPVPCRLSSVVRLHRLLTNTILQILTRPCQRRR